MALLPLKVSLHMDARHVEIIQNSPYYNKAHAIIDLFHSSGKLSFFSGVKHNCIDNTPLNHYDASNHHFASLKNDLIS